MDYAQSIVTGGLNEGAARAASTGGLYSRPGSFFTFNVTEGGTEALQLAYEFGLAKVDQPVVLMGRLPESVYNELVSAGHVYVGSVPGVDIPETVFAPGAFGQLNEAMQWNIIDRYQGMR